MCVTLHDASLGQTTIAGWRYHPRRTHCLLYGNEPENRAAAANAMILHIPVAMGTALGQANFIPTRGLRHGTRPYHRRPRLLAVTAAA